MRFLQDMYRILYNNYYTMYRILYNNYYTMYRILQNNYYTMYRILQNIIKPIIILNNTGDFVYYKYYKYLYKYFVDYEYFL